MTIKGRYREVTCGTCALAAVLAVVIIARPLPADGPLLDLLVRVRAAVSPLADRPEQSSVAVIALDRRSLEAPELAPFPRVLMGPFWAALMDGVFQAGARAVGFDLVFAYNANQLLPNYDASFLAALAQHRERVVLARSAATLPALPFLAALRNDEGALGLAELVADSDGRYRRLRARHGTAPDGMISSLAGALLRRANAPVMPEEVLLAPRRHLERIPAYAAIDVFRCAKQAPDALARAFGEKIVLVGGTLPEEDRRISSGRFLTPMRGDAAPLHPCGLRRLGASDPDSSSVPGVFLHAAAVDAVTSGRVTRTTAVWAVAGLSGLTSAGGAALALTSSPWLAAGAVVVIAALLVSAGTLALAQDLWFPLALPLATLVAAPALAYVVRYLVEERTRRRIQHAFSHYLSPAIVDRLAADPTALRLGGERREVTVMFADLSGFTALSGTVEPEVLTSLVNQYLGYVVEQVEATGGYVDKFIGDAVLAIWGAPAPDATHAENAVRAALAAVARIRREHDAAAARGEKGFSVKIGLNSGPAVIGNVGTARRYNYTAVGETVNVASRLESVPSLYGCQVVIGPRTAELVRDWFLLRELDWIKVKGGQAPIAVFEPLGPRAQATPEQVDRAGRFAEALARYRAGRFTDACALWETLAHEEQAGSAAQSAKDGLSPGPSAKMAARARELAHDPPSDPWDGVLVLTSK